MNKKEMECLSIRRRSLVMLITLKYSQTNILLITFNHYYHARIYFQTLVQLGAAHIYTIE